MPTAPIVQTPRRLSSPFLEHAHCGAGSAPSFSELNPAFHPFWLLPENRVAGQGPERICIPRDGTAPPPPARPLPSSGRFRPSNAGRESPPLRGIRFCSSSPMRQSQPLRRKLCKRAFRFAIRQGRVCTDTCGRCASEWEPRIRRGRSSWSRPKANRAFPAASSTRTEGRATRAESSSNDRFRRS